MPVFCYLPDPRLKYDMVRVTGLAHLVLCLAMILRRTYSWKSRLNPSHFRYSSSLYSTAGGSGNDRNPDEHYMKLALKHAQYAFREKEVPVGAVVVDENGDVISASRNRVEEECDASAHAEINALRKAAKFKNNWRLIGCTLYSTLEPCPMCMSAIQSFRIKRVVYAAKDTRLGACGSYIDLVDNFKHPFHKIEVKSGLLEEESSSLMKRFFLLRRRENEELKSTENNCTDTNVDRGVDFDNQV